MAWKETSPDKIGHYYQHEFEKRFSQIPNFISSSQPKEIGIAFPEPYPVKGDNIPPKEFIRRDAFDRRDQLDSWQDILRFIQSPPSNDPIRGNHQLASPEVVDKPAVPEAVYYATDFRDRNWLLTVDIDAKDVALQWAEQAIDKDTSQLTDDEIKAEAGVLDADPAGYPYRFKDIDHTLEYGFEVQEYYRDHLGTNDTQVVYSGQGCHIYLHDPEKMYDYSETNRNLIADTLIDRLNIPIDKPVTTDESRVIRLPYSLHSGVSRVVTPIYEANFDYREKAKPDFLKPAQG